MADGNQLKIGDQVELADDDPFAELTRIMGFDPRQSVKQAEAEKAAREAEAEPAPRDSAQQDSHASDHDDSDDFSIDLEKELMGEFSVDDDGYDAVPQAAAEPEPAAPVAHAGDQEPEAGELDIDFDFDSAIAASVESDFAPSGEPGEPADEPDMVAEAPVEGDHEHVDHDIAAELHAAMDDVDLGLDDHASVLGAPEDEATAAHEQEAVAPSAEADAETHDDMDLGLHADDLHLDDFEADAAPVEVQPAEPASEEAEFHLDPSDLDLSGEASDDDSFAPAAAEIGLSDEAEHEADFDFSLNAADLDLGADEPEAYEPEAERTPEFAAELRGSHDVEAYVEEVPASAEEPSGDADFGFEDIDFASGEAELSVEQNDPETDPYEEPEAYAQPDDLEPEAYEEPAREDVPEPAAPRAPSPMDLAAAEYRDRDPLPADLASAFNLEDELKALLGDYAASNAPVEQPVAASVPAEPRAEAQGGDDLAWELDDLVEAAAAAEAEAAHTAQPDEADDDLYTPAFASQPAQSDDRHAPARAPNPYLPAAAAATAATVAAAAPRPSMFSRATSFGTRQQQRADDSGADYRDRKAAAWPSARSDEPRDPMREDPLAVIAELTAKYSQPLPTDPAALDARDGGYDEAPDVETIEVADRAVALADDLDIPDVDYQDELPPVSAYDDLDSDFASLLHDLNDSDAAPAEPAGRYAESVSNGYQVQEQAYRPSVAQGSRNASTIPGMHSEPDHYPAVDDLPGSRPTRASRFADDDFGYDPDLDDALAVPGMAHAHGEERPQRRGLMVAAIVGGVALIGALGAFALSSGGDDGAETVAIVKADDGPVKVKPENPGGTTVPNQDSKVYETVAGEGTTTDPQQQTLVTTAEEPADIEDDPVVAAKSEDRIEQILQETENQSDAQLAAVAPRKVRTMVVRPDGTLVPREETEAASDNLATDSVASAGAAVTEPVPDSTGALPAAGQEEAMATFEEEPSVMNGEPAEEPAAAVAEAPAPAPAVETAAAPRATDTPATAPIAPQRPAEQPIDVVGEVKPDQVASAATSAAGGGWSMQIASQPNEAAAQSSYQNLARRYSSVLEGRPVNIVKADIAGKGTFWRVRVPAPSRNDAIALCETYKAAGGNCFVSR
ncbi:MAG: SPOR domain-containing protein [Alphaproteobacteria bacterium]|nr:SPOR domain-containing protein [Alphaproteobacteria bacterium]MBU0802314.1 SPOR domain-containing protein [Alphaproteobacteria bacterium]MBU0870244.1 SPOR domain-containing protein [Alphaproteobacteria bacterium]MBU1399813.1 SPOR domain-containing protein [Alphaproteobacteria bacterium]MBU1590199.1 SPOR domain-containing protein [Alphaproteobacteria bacterium]